MQYDPELKTEIEVRFFPDGDGRTRVELDRYGARRDQMREFFDKGGNWSRLLQMFADAAAP